MAGRAPGCPFGLGQFSTCPFPSHYPKPCHSCHHCHPCGGGYLGPITLERLRPLPIDSMWVGRAQEAAGPRGGFHVAVEEEHWFSRCPGASRRSAPSGLPAGGRTVTGNCGKRAREHRCRAPGRAGGRASEHGVYKAFLYFITSRTVYSLQWLQGNWISFVLLAK